jgi:hypothetical protein
MRAFVLSVLLVAGCGDSAVNACYNVCQTLSGCFTSTNLTTCRSTCDRAPTQCRNDKVVTDMLTACAESKCDRIIGCLVAFEGQYPQCNPNTQDGGP